MAPIVTTARLRTSGNTTVDQVTRHDLHGSPCAHTPDAICWLCSSQRPWWREARIQAGLDEEPPNPREERPRYESNRSSRWSASDVAELLAGRREGRTHREIGAAVGRTMDAVRLKWRKVRPRRADGTIYDERHREQAGASERFYLEGKP